MWFIHSIRRQKSTSNISQIEWIIMSQCALCRYFDIILCVIHNNNFPSPTYSIYKLGPTWVMKYQLSPKRHFIQRLRRGSTLLGILGPPHQFIIQLRLCSGHIRWGPHWQKQHLLPVQRQVIWPSNWASSFSRSNCSSSRVSSRLSSFAVNGVPLAPGLLPRGTYVSWGASLTFPERRFMIDFRSNTVWYMIYVEDFGMKSVRYDYDA